MSREFFRFDLCGLDGVAHSVMAHQVTHLTDIWSDMYKDKAGTGDKAKPTSIIGTRVHFIGGGYIDVREVRDAIFNKDKWQIFKKAGN